MFPFRNKENLTLLKTRSKTVDSRLGGAPGAPPYLWLIMTHRRNFSSQNLL